MKQRAAQPILFLLVYAALVILEVTLQAASSTFGSALTAGRGSGWLPAAVLLHFLLAFWASLSVYILSHALVAQAVGMTLYSVVTIPFAWRAKPSPRLRWVGLAPRALNSTGYAAFGSPSPTRAQVTLPLISGPVTAFLLFSSSAALAMMNRDIVFAGVWAYANFLLFAVSIIPYRLRGRPSAGLMVWQALLQPHTLIVYFKGIWASCEALAFGRPRSYTPEFLQQLADDSDLTAHASFYQYASLMDRGRIEEAGPACDLMAEAAQAPDLIIRSVILWEAASYAWRHGSSREAAIKALETAKEASSNPALLSWKVVAARVQGDEAQAQKEAQSVLAVWKKLAQSTENYDHVVSIVQRLLDPEIPMPLAGTGFGQIKNQIS